jgi:hypothetical protein
MPSISISPSPVTYARQAADEEPCLVFGQDGGQSFGAFGAQGVNRTQLLVEHLAIEEKECAEGVVLCRSGDMFLDSQVGEKGFDLGSAHPSTSSGHRFRGVTHTMEVDVALDPANVDLLRAIGIVFEADGIADLI